MDSADDNKPSVLRDQGRRRDPAVGALLLDVVRGKAGKELSRSEGADQEPGLQASAALALAVLKRTSG